MAESTSRRLVRVPVIHTTAELGTVGDSVRDAHTRAVGRQGWGRHTEHIEALWRRIAHAVDRLALDYGRTRLYQDGLSSCSYEQRIVYDLAETGSENHRLLRRLMQRGATLTGTESIELLLEEYELAQNTAGATDREAHSRQILERRDRAIARRIGQTLRPGETGLAFLGMLHDIDRFLPHDIDVQVVTIDTGTGSGDHSA